MHPSEVIARTIDQITARARELAHMVRPESRPDTLPHPAGVYGVLAELRQTVGHLDEVCKHLIMHTLDLSTDERLHHDRHGHGREAAEDARDAATELDRAHRVLRRAYTALDLAQGAYGPLSLREFTVVGVAAEGVG